MLIRDKFRWEKVPPLQKEAQNSHEIVHTGL